MNFLVLQAGFHIKRKAILFNGSNKIKVRYIRARQYNFDLDDKQMAANHPTNHTKVRPQTLNDH
jgi:hypothetical protein